MTKRNVTMLAAAALLSMLLAPQAAIGGYPLASSASWRHPTTPGPDGALWFRIVLLVTLQAMLLVGILIRKLRHRTAESWPMMRANVQVLTRPPVKWDENPVVVVAYSYIVAGEYYGGSFARHFRREGAASKFADDFRDRTIPVRYNPERPEQSYVLLSDLEDAAAQP